MKTLDITKLTSEEDWNIGSIHVEYTGHLYYGSAIESYDNCGTCDGAKCDVCQKVVTNDILEFSCASDKFEKYLIKAGAPKDVASEFAYSDSVGNSYKGYYLNWPTSVDLQQINPDLYKKLTTMDTTILNEIISEIPNYRVFGDLMDCILSKHNLTTYDYESFVYKQLELFWKLNNETHDIFKLPDERFPVIQFGFTDFVFTNPKADPVIQQSERERFGNLRFRASNTKVNDWICYCDEEGIWKADQISKITNSNFILKSGESVMFTDLLTETHKIEDFNAERYNNYKDDRLHPGNIKLSTVF